MLLIPAPNKIEFIKQTDNKGDFVIEPLYPGYGLTVGNALRRVLLSSIPGAAITSVKIAGVDHEFSSLSYIKEDIVDILLNVKEVNLKVDSEIDKDEPLVIKLEKTGEGKVTASDFKCPSQVSVVNKDQLIATLTDKAAKFEMECLIGKGRGYLPTESRDEKLEIGHLAVDAVFTPINHVNITTEHVRVGEMTNWDKLVLSLETNGAISCQEAFDLAVDILTDQFGSLKAKPEAEEKVEEKEEEVVEEEEEEVKEEAKEEVVEELVEEPVSPAGREKPKKKRGRPKKEDK